jgi:hypothetical protein
MKPTIGRIVLYRQRYGLQTWLPAIVTVTEDTYKPGYFANPQTEEGRERLTHNSSPQYDLTNTLDADGEAFVASPVPSLKDSGRVHLQVFSPLGRNYVEYNVREGTLPGQWKWPEIVK